MAVHLRHRTSRGGCDIDEFVFNQWGWVFSGGIWEMHAAQIASGITGAARYSEILLLMSGLIAVSLLIYAFPRII